MFSAGCAERSNRMAYDIGVIGYGFVGEAVAKGFARTRNVLVYDKVKGWVGLHKDGDVSGHPAQGEWEDFARKMVEEVGTVFVCVPTPMLPDGRCDTSIVEGVVKELSIRRLCLFSSGRPVVVIKSTVPPGTTDRLQKQYRSLRLVFSPEFLTEANHLADFAGQRHVVLGTPNHGCEEEDYRKLRELEDLFYGSFSLSGVLWMSASEAEMLKYLVNCLLATKVSLANEFHLLCDRLGIDYETVRAGAYTVDPRMGTHLRVPGPDGHYGFGGSCFPKDVNALLATARSSEVTMNVLEAAWRTNLEARPERDWEQLKGRAVV